MQNKHYNDQTFTAQKFNFSIETMIILNNLIRNLFVYKKHRDKYFGIVTKPGQQFIQHHQCQTNCDFFPLSEIFYTSMSSMHSFLSKAMLMNSKFHIKENPMKDCPSSVQLRCSAAHRLQPVLSPTDPHLKCTATTECVLIISLLSILTSLKINLDEDEPPQNLQNLRS